MGEHRERPERRTADIVRKENEGAPRTLPPLRAHAIAEKLGMTQNNAPEREKGAPVRRRFMIQTPRSRFVRNALFGVVTLVVLGGGIIAFGGYQSLRGVAHSSVQQFQGALNDLRLWRPGAAREKFIAVRDNLANPFDALTERLASLFQKSNEALKNIQSLTGSAIALTEELSRLEEQLDNFLFNQRGKEVIAYLERLDGLLATLIEEGKTLSVNAKELHTGVPVDVVPFQVDVARFHQLVKALATWFKEPGEQHVLVFLQNPSEMRPAGGFLGSYVDLVLHEGHLEKMEVHDVNDVDRKLALNVVPPKPLQLITKRWRAADANWFFDFSDSASAVIHLMEASDFYKEQKVAFDGAIALSPRVIKDLLELTGPVAIEGYATEFTSENFLTEIQTHVQVGQEQNASYPKEVIRELTPVLLERFRTLSDEQRDELVSRALAWFEHRDLMVYFKDATLEQFFDYYGATGKPYALPQNFQGDYLAIVDANVNGGKTDLFVEQHVRLQSHVDDDGVVRNTVTLTRTHRGDEGGYWWYKVPHQTYLRLFTPPGSRLTGLTGGIEKKIEPPVNYKAAKYVEHPLVVQIEKTASPVFNFPAVQSFEESGKTVFATWVRTFVGEKSSTTLEYAHRLPFAPRDGQLYEVIVDKQAGTTRTYELEVTAPVGFRWKENSLPIYEYITEELPGRLEITLTLEKI